MINSLFEISKWQKTKQKRTILFVRIIAYTMLILSIIWSIVTFIEQMYQVTVAILILVILSIAAIRLIFYNYISAAKLLILLSVTVYFFGVCYFGSGYGIINNGTAHFWFIFIAILSYFLLYDFQPLVRDIFPFLLLVLFFLFHFGYAPVNLILKISPEVTSFINMVTVITLLASLYFFTRYFVIEITRAEETIAASAGSLEQEAELHKQRNVQLQESLLKLKQAQMQLIQSEKMASLGQLTAGVAHEINNPINFVSANVKPLKRDINDIMTLLEKYSEIDQHNYLEKLAEVMKIKNQIDLNYTIKEIKSLLNGIEEGSKRTAEIVRGLRNFSRLDEEDMKKANINGGIVSTLVVLNSKLKHANIEVINSFDNLPEIDCYPGQLNQVFMNILGNAIDSIGEPDSSQSKNQKIFITTSCEKDLLKISIRDTGKGMSEEVKQKIFEPFFTTKDVGKGTGLGLSISFGIIEKHNGTIKVNTEEQKGTEFVISLPFKTKNK